MYKIFRFLFYQLLCAMWKSISNAITSFGQKKDSAKPSQTCHEYSDDDDICSNESTEEGLECPICWESFNIVENVPYVLWCGHSLCKNCLLGLKSASVKISSQQVQIPLFVSCPWCNLPTFRLVYQGNLKFPSKNFFLLWMVESRNGDRMKSSSTIYRDQLLCSFPCTSITRNPSSVMNCRRAHRLGSSASGTSGPSNTNDIPTVQRAQFSLQKSLDFFFRLTSKFPLVVVLLVVVMVVIPSSVGILILYLVITILFGLPSLLVLYFAYPALDWLVKEITA